MRLVFRLLARLPLRANQALGALVGRVVYALSPRFRRRTRENVAASGVAGSGDRERFARTNAAEVGKGTTELAWALFRRDDVVRLTRAGAGWDEVQRLRAGSRPILFATPHLGNYDVAGRWLVSCLPVIAMYRPHKLGWLDRLLREGRDADAGDAGRNVAPANLAGVRTVLRHLKAGGCSMVLPDQVPGVGEGEWVAFFGRPAYTMTLVGRLQQASGAAVVFCFAERLPRGEGFLMHFAPMSEPLPRDRAAAAALVNARVEELVRGCPVQYLWGYNRYKRPAGAPPAPESKG